MIPERDMEMTKENPLGMYLHVPFCSSTCDFCAFYQEKPSKNGRNSYFLGLEKEISKFPGDRDFQTIFVGGGTPGLLTPQEISKLGSLVKGAGLSKNFEWTIEIAPTEITFQKLERLLEIGVNRISLGVQTFDPLSMRQLGRKHKAENAKKAYSMIREVGFKSINLDLIFGIPNQTIEKWEEDLIQAVELEPEHLSTYCLTFEENTALHLRMKNGEIKVDQDKEVAFYEKTWGFLPHHGFHQYEISNFSKLGHECRHNLNTWKMNEWIGYGPSAFTQYKGVRRKNLSNLEKWFQQLSNDIDSKFQENHKLEKQELGRDAVVFGLRMNAGIDLRKIAIDHCLPQEAFESIEEFLRKLEVEGLCRLESQRYMLTSEGRMLVDAVASELPELVLVSN